MESVDQTRIQTVSNIEQDQIHFSLLEKCHKIKTLIPLSKLFSY